MGLAREGYKEIVVGTVVLAAAAWALSLLHPAAALPMFVIWVWLISFFRDPARHADLPADAMCAPADGRITEITQLPHHNEIGGPAVRIGMFLSIFNVHANRAPCAATVVSVTHAEGLYLDARHPDSGPKNESNTLVLEPEAPFFGRTVVRQVAGFIARRIVCHARPGDRLARGQRFGMIKFGSRTELIVPQSPGLEIAVEMGQSVRAGLTVMLRQKSAKGENRDESGTRGRVEARA
jgi:phosphatidylserine decarboxylase